MHNKSSESERKRMSEQWHQKKSDIARLSIKNKQLELELEGCKAELENLLKKYQELCEKQTVLERNKESDAIYIKKLREDLVRVKTNNKILSDERDILAKINEELSVSNHLKSTELVNLKSVSRPSDDFKFAIEMNISLENKLKSYEFDIHKLKLELLQSNEAIARLQSELSSQSKPKENHENKGLTPTQNDFHALLEELNSLNRKYKIFEEENMRLTEANNSLREKLQILSAQVQSDHYLILHLREKHKFSSSTSLDPSMS